LSAIDFYLNGDLHWGLELLVNGQWIKEHIGRFKRDSKYCYLNMKEFAIVDFRCNQSGDVCCIPADPDRITVVFKYGDFLKCMCRVRWEEPATLTLKH